MTAKIGKPEAMTKGPAPVYWKPRFLAKVALPDENGCMNWLGSVDRNGYGRFGMNNGLGPTVWNAHRAAWLCWIGEPTPGLELDHICRNRRCVRPSHLREVTRQGNLLAPGSLSVAAKRAAVTHCPRGHEYTPENTRIKKSNGTRQCRACDRYYNERKARGD